MAALSIRDLDDDVRDRLRARAARNGRSMEAEVRAILAAAVREFADVEGVEVNMPPATPAPGKQAGSGWTA
jgi:plasmid stability protein